MATPGSLPWTAAVRIRSDLELERSLIDRLSLEPRRRTVWVVDLVDPRTAYYRHTAPVPPSPEQAERMRGGREAHEAIETALAEAPHREVRVVREGIVGTIDLYDDRPTELKSTGRPLGAEAVREQRPAYLEQLGLYCALVGRAEGRLLLTMPDDPQSLRAFDASFPRLDRVWAEALRGAEGLRGALDRHSPSGLPACAWRGRGCPYEEQRVCECTGAESELAYPVAALVGEFVERVEDAERLRARWASPPPDGKAAPTFRELQYPRRVYFEQTAGPNEGQETAGSRAPSDPDGLYVRLAELLESGPPGEASRVHPTTTLATGAVACFRGTPYLLKVTRAWKAAPPAQLLLEQPHYFLELGLRCAALGAPEGWLILGYERAETPRDRVRVYRVGFDPLSAMVQMAVDRRAGLEGALATGDPTAAAPCPAWMFRTCPYRETCRCGVTDPAARSG